jgi:hypothetical protein
LPSISLIPSPQFTNCQEISDCLRQLAAAIRADSCKFVSSKQGNKAGASLVASSRLRSQQLEPLPSQSVLWLGARAPFNGRVVEAECLNHKEVAWLKSFTVAPGQYPVVQVPVSQLPPSVVHSSVRNTSQTQIAFLGSDGSTVQRLLRHHVQGVTLGQRRTFLPCLNCSSENAEYTVRMPLTSVVGAIVLHGTEAMLAPSSTAQKQIAFVGSPGCGMHKADVQSAY